MKISKQDLIYKLQSLSGFIGLKLDFDGMINGVDIEALKKEVDDFCDELKNNDCSLIP